jgi:hypothetical protein
VLSIVNTPSHAPSSSHFIVIAPPGRPTLFRHFNTGGFRLRDADRFFEYGREIPSFVAAESARDVFPHHESGANKLACPSSGSVMLSHLLYYPYLFYEKAGTRSSQTGPFTGDGQILTRRTSRNTPDRLDLRAIDFRNITQMLHFFVPFAMRR